MKPIVLNAAGAIALTFTIAACVPAPEPTPVPRTATTPVPRPTPTPTPMPIFSNWMDAPKTPGDWSYSAAPTGGTAIFGEPSSGARFTMRCDRASGLVVLSRAGAASGPAQIRILTETATRTLTAQPAANGMSMLEASLRSSDPLLDAMALTKGRFAVEATGLPTLYLPAWAEVSRVIEDCR